MVVVVVVVVVDVVVLVEVEVVGKAVVVVIFEISVVVGTSEGLRVLVKSESDVDFSVKSDFPELMLEFSASL